MKHFLSGGLLLGACLLVIFLSFISLDLALIAGVIVTLAAFFDLTQGQTRNLECFLQNTLKEISARQEALEKTILSYHEDIRKMEHQIAQTKVNVKANNIVLQEHNKAFSFNEIIPSFLKPQSWGRNQQMMHEGEEEEDDIGRDDDSGDVDSDDADADAVLETTKTTQRTPPVIAAYSYGGIANDEIMLDDHLLSDMVVRELVHHAVKSNRIDVFVQPILRLPQRQVKFYEMFARIRAKAGVYLPAKRYIDLATEENVMVAIDNMLLLHGLQSLRKNRDLKRVSSFFINVKPQTLRDRAFMNDLLNFLGQNRDLAPSLIFEIRQDDFENLSRGERQILQGLGQLGCSLSLDNISAIPESIKMLQDNKIRFIKIDAQKLLSAAITDRDFTEMLRHKRKLEANGIGVIVEKIENESDLLELLDYNINYGQGYLFGRPDLQGVYARLRVS